MSVSLQETIRTAARKVVESLIAANRELAHYIENPFLPYMERNKLLQQIRENQLVIERLLLMKAE